MDPHGGEVHGVAARRSVREVRSPHPGLHPSVVGFDGPNGHLRDVHVGQYKHRPDEPVGTAHTDRSWYRRDVGRS
jgi:hypothetical protein